MIHLEITVADTADLLDPNAYGAGALLRWESGAAAVGPFVEGGTVALVADQSLYDVWDAAGATGTWYRTRISDAGGTTFSPYSSTFQTADLGLYLSASQFRAFNACPQLTDEALLILLEAAAEAIVKAVGPGGTRTERQHVHGDLLMLTAVPLSITTVTEHGTVLDPDDYEVSGQTLRRLHDGPNPAYRWHGWVTVVYEPVDDTAERQRVQRQLVELELSFQPGLASQSIGTWSETYQSSGSKSYAQQREEILASLYGGVGIL